MQHTVNLQTVAFRIPFRGKEICEVCLKVPAIKPVGTLFLTRLWTDLTWKTISVVTHGKAILWMNEALDVAMHEWTAAAKQLVFVHSFQPCHFLLTTLTEFVITEVNNVKVLHS